MTADELKTWRLSHRARKRQGKPHRGMSQQDLADYLGVPVKTLQNWEQSRTAVPNWVAVRLNSR